MLFHSLNGDVQCAGRLGAGATAGGDAAPPALPGRIRYFGETEISGSRLSPASIAAAHPISVRQLHRLFEEEDGAVGEPAGRVPA